MNIYAYARVSSRDQNLGRQIAAFTDFGVDRRRIFFDKQSGKDFERTQYKRLIKKLRAGDLLVIGSIDRLGRDYDQIISQWSYITGTLGADISVLDMPLLDTRAKSDTLVGKFISDVVLQVLSFVAQNEREKIKERQAEGIRLAKQNGVRFGRPETIYSQQFMNITEEYICGRMTSLAACEALGISRENFYYHVRKLKRARRYVYAATREI